MKHQMNKNMKNELLNDIGGFNCKNDSQNY